MENWIIYKNIRVAYYCYGKGPKTLVLLHGFLENASMWKFLVEEFSRKFNIICVDLLGHGNSDCLGYVHTMEEFAESVKIVLAKEKVSNATFVGHSMGGYIALALAEKHPTMIEKLCLLNSTAHADTEVRKISRDKAMSMAKTNYKALVSMAINNLFASDTAKIFKEEILDCKKQALKIKVQGFIAATEGMKKRKERIHILQSIAFKSLFIVGKKDPILPVENSIEEAKKTQTPIVQLPNGHMSHIENKQELLIALHAFFE